MRIFVVVNQIAELSFRQTTSLLVAALSRQDSEVWLVNVDDFSVAADDADCRMFAKAIPVPVFAACRSEQIETLAKSSTGSSLQGIMPGDAILIRTNPGRDISRSHIHESFLHLCVAAIAIGVRVVNSPENLRYFASKSSLISVVPEFRPAMLVTGDVQQVVDFVSDAAADCVVKPLFGSRGQNVIRLCKSQSIEEIESVVASTFGPATLVVQQFVDAEHPGDKRVVVVGGEVLTVGQHIAGIERRPATDDFRANLHAGGTAHPLTLSGEALVAVQYAAKLLHENGIWLAGVDLIGDKIIEFNVFSTGGLYDSIKFSGVPFDDMIAERFLG